MLFRSKKPTFSISIARGALESVFDECDRYDAEASRRPTMTQAALLLNDKLVRERVKVQKGSRLEKLLKNDKPTASKDLLDELFLATLARPPLPEESKAALDLVTKTVDKREAWEALLWALLNTNEFLFRY